MTAATHRQLLKAFADHGSGLDDSIDDGLVLGLTINRHFLIANLPPASDSVAQADYEGPLGKDRLAQWLTSQIANLSEASRPLEIGTRFVPYTPIMSGAVRRAIFPVLAALNIVCAMVALFAPLIPVNAAYTATVQSVTYSAACLSVAMLILAVCLSWRRARWLFMSLPAAILWPAFMLAAAL